MRALPADDWEPWLLERSDLPGPRANLELVGAVADEAPAGRLRAWASLSPRDAPAGTAAEFLPACGTAGLGRLLVDAGSDRLARDGLLADLADLADDPRWRIRECVAIALQRWGSTDLSELLEVMAPWAASTDRLRQRAAVAALCEPSLLHDEGTADRVVTLLDGVTRSLMGATDERTDPFRVLRQALGYGWSVAVVAAPATGRAAMERWMAQPDPNVRWVMRENLKKARLKRLDAAWVAAMRRRSES